MNLDKKISLFVSACLLNGVIYKASYAEEVASISAPSVAVEETKNELYSSSNALKGRELSVRREATLGETLNDIPGISSSYFGPNASRPIIRGMEGERAQIMQNGTGVMDASSASPDHAVGLDPMVAEQIEVIRGPASLIYGTGNVGGIINVTDHRIPKEPLDGMIGRGVHDMLVVGMPIGPPLHPIKIFIQCLFKKMYYIIYSSCFKWAIYRTTMH